MQTQFEQFAKILPLLTILAVLSYWTGKWYTEWYFDQFSISYHTIRFDKYHYLHASWNTILTAICLGMILMHVGVTLYISPAWYWLIITLIISLVSVVILTRWPYKFNPTFPFFRKLIGSREFSLQATGWLSLGVTFIIVNQYPQKRISMLSDIYTVIQQNFIINILISLIIIWVYLALVGYFLGKYHGQSAIWEGRMGIKWAKIEGQWWLLVLRTIDERNLVYDRIHMVSKFVPDDKITQIKNFTYENKHKVKKNQR